MRENTIILFIMICVFLPCYGREQSPYDVSLEMEISLSGVGLSFLGVNAFLKTKIKQERYVDPSTLSIQAINPVDRFFISGYNKNSALFTDIIQGTLLLAAPTVFLFTGEYREIGKILIMYLETTLISHGIVNLVKSIVPRFRPFTYLETSAQEFPLNSFYSAHTNMAFTSASFLTSVFAVYHRHSPWRFVVGALSYAGAALVGIHRVTAGMHYLTDVVTGAMVGTLLGWFIPYIHKTEGDKPSSLVIQSTIDSGIFLGWRIDLL